MGYRLGRKRLRKDLEIAYYMARRHKKDKSYVRSFEERLSQNLDDLADSLFNRTYVPSPSFCFIIHEPKIREIFAAAFTDRIVHHLFFNYVQKMFDSLFIEDSYSCRYGKGTHYGVRRLFGHIRKASENYTKEVFILQLDIKGYFISIDRMRLLEIVNGILEKMCRRRIPQSEGGYRYEDRIDFDFVRWLGGIIIMLEPSENCIIKSPLEAWDALPDSKSLFKARKSCGLPIGNLTSQLLSNVYLNELDQYAKRILHCRHYGRYVDDLYVVDGSKERLAGIAESIRVFLKENLHLSLNEGKTRITSSRRGVQFLGYFVKEHRVYLCNKTLRRMVRRLSSSGVSSSTINSYLGMFRHCASYRMRRKTLMTKELMESGVFDVDCMKYKNFNQIEL